MTVSAAPGSSGGRGAIRELLDEAGVFPDLAGAQAAVDGFLHEYNTNRPHQSLDMAFPADRFRPNTTTEGAALAPAPPGVDHDLRRPKVGTFGDHHWPL